jgi:hypothetical protein
VADISHLLSREGLNGLIRIFLLVLLNRLLEFLDCLLRGFSVFQWIYFFWKRILQQLDGAFFEMGLWILF